MHNEAFPAIKHSSPLWLTVNHYVYNQAIALKQTH